MNDRDTPQVAAPVTPEIRRRGGISPFWAFPIVALLVGIWLAYLAISEKGPTITIQFRTAAGLEAGKTRVKHDDIELGVVDRLDPSPDLAHVDVVVKMNKRARGHLSEKTRFWVVRPRFSLSGISGIETLVSGAYIEMDPAPGTKQVERFHGLDEPPVISSDVSGREFVLTTDTLGSIGPRSPIYLRGIKVGEVISYDATDPSNEIKINVFIRAPFDKHIFDGTRFWNASGISLTTGAGGFKIQVESLEAVISGGIAFETPESVRSGEPSASNTTFRLFADRSEAQAAGYARTFRAIVEFGGSVSGLAPGSAVEFRGLRIGRVVDFYLGFEPSTNSFHVPVTIEFEIDRVKLMTGDPVQFGGGRMLPELVRRGMRAQLKTASLITGELIVAFDMFPDAPQAQMLDTKPYPTLPTLPNQLENISRSVSQTLDKVAALPLDEIAADLRKVLRSLNDTVGNPEIKEMVSSLNKTARAAERVATNADTQVGPLLQNLRQASEAANVTIRRADSALKSIDTGYGNDSSVHRQVSELLRQLRDTARSIKLLADFVEQHPEAFIRGKPERTR